MTWHLRQIAAFLIEPPARPDPRQTPILDRFCIVFLATDWILFGSMHFSAHELTRQMLPSMVPFPDGIVAATGGAEVMAGILMLYPRMRRAAAFLSLILLCLLMPAVLHILHYDSALPFSNQDPASGLNRVWRLLMVPHLAVMAMCSVHVLLKPYPDPGATRAAVIQLSGAGGRQAILSIAIILLLCNAAGFLAIELGVRGDKPTAALWMMMCLAVGGLLGFLFAVPRTAKEAPGPNGLQPNRNIEEISDWLTKIIVGLGLLNFKDIAALLSARAASLAPVLQVDPNFSMSMIVYFTVAGFLEGYLLTRIFLQRYFIDAIGKPGFDTGAGET